MAKKLKQIKDYLTNVGGAAEFHTLSDLCISVKNDKLYEVVHCKKSQTNPFGVTDIPFNPSAQLTDKILTVINS